MPVQRMVRVQPLVPKLRDQVQIVGRAGAQPAEGKGSVRAGHCGLYDLVMDLGLVSAVSSLDLQDFGIESEARSRMYSPFTCRSSDC